MLTITPDLSRISLAAGEPLLLEIQCRDAGGAVQAMTGRAFVLSFYRADRSVAKAIAGESAANEVVRFVRDGSFSESLCGETLAIELAERLKGGRAVLATGTLIVQRSAAAVESFDSGVIGRAIARVTIRDAAQPGDAPVFSLAWRAFADAAATPVTVGFIGSSSPARYVSSGSPTPDPRIRLLSDTTGGFEMMTTGTFCAGLGAVLLRAFGRGLDVIPGGVEGSSLNGWDSDSRYLAAFVARVQKAGRIDALVMQVGGNDVANRMVGTVAEQMTRIRSVIAKARAALGKSDLPVLLCPTQDYPAYPAALAIQRQAEIRVANADTGVFYGISVHDVPLESDGTHQKEPDGYRITGPRLGRQLAAILGGTVQQRGAFASAATPVSATQTDVAITHRLGSDFTPTSGIAGFAMTGSGGGAIAIGGAVRRSADTVRLTHAARTAGEAATLLYMPNGGGADDAAVIHDNGPDALPMESSAAPLALAAWGSPTPTPTPAPAASGFSDSFTGTDGIGLAAHLSDSGHSWSVTTGAFVLSSGRAFAPSVPSNAVLGWTPDGTACTIDFTIDALSLVGQNTLVRFRIASDTSYYYAGIINGGQSVVIGHTLGGSATNAAVAPLNAVAGQSYSFRLIVPATGGTIRLALGGADILTLADSQAALAGKGAIGLRQSITAASTTTGFHFTALAVSDG